MSQTFTIEPGQAHDDVVELAKAWAGTTIAFAITTTGVANLLTPIVLQNLLIAAIVCGLGFVLHELAHRQVARGYGAAAHFAADNRWLLISIGLAFAGIFIAAPGAVWHTGVSDSKRIGKIALAGPLANYILALFFLVLYPILFMLGVQDDIFLYLCMMGFSFNAWVGLFNLIPGGPFDGAKVLAWSTPVYAVMVAVGAFMAFYMNRQEVYISLWGWFINLFG